MIFTFNQLKFSMLLCGEFGDREIIGFLVTVNERSMMCLDVDESCNTHIGIDIDGLI